MMFLVRLSLHVLAVQTGRYHMVDRNDRKYSVCTCKVYVNFDKRKHFRLLCLICLLNTCSPELSRVKPLSFYSKKKI